MDNNLTCSFAGHRNEWYNINIEERLESAIESLINQGVNIFYDGNYGEFDKKARNAVLNLKKKYPKIRLILVLTYYHENAKHYSLPDFYDGSVYPELEHIHYKQKITKRNEWIVDNSDYVISHIVNEYKSGAFKTVKYAEKQKKNIIKL